MTVRRTAIDEADRDLRRAAARHGEGFRALRLRAGATRDAIGRAVGVRRSRFCRVERGDAQSFGVGRYAKATARIGSVLGFGIALTVSALAPVVSVRGASPPPATISRYMATASTTTHYTLGCSRAFSKIGGGIVLIYGKPLVVNGEHGATLYGGPNSTVTQIGSAVKQFARGYLECSNDSQPLSPHIVLIVATTNCGPSVPGVCGTVNTTTKAHGVAWANMVDDIGAYLSSNGFASLVTIAGGSDMEPAWNTVVNTKSWVDGYDSANQYLMYDVGSADGCPQSGTGTANGGCANGWKQGDLLYVAWLSPPAHALPQVYTNSRSQAKQWRYAKLYGIVSLGRNMTINGSLTQNQACIEVGCSTDVDNTPVQGWQQLYDQLNADARTAQSLNWSTDISWED